MKLLLLLVIIPNLLIAKDFLELTQLKGPQWQNAHLGFGTQYFVAFANGSSDYKGKEDKGFAGFYHLKWTSSEFTSVFIMFGGGKREQFSGYIQRGDSVYLSELKAKTHSNITFLMGFEKGWGGKWAAITVGAGVGLTHTEKIEEQEKCVAQCAFRTDTNNVVTQTALLVLGNLESNGRLAHFTTNIGQGPTLHYTQNDGSQNQLDYLLQSHLDFFPRSWCVPQINVEYLNSLGLSAGLGLTLYFR